MAAIIKINGVEALACWDSGAQLDCISPDFIRAIGLEPQSRCKPLKIHLGTKGSTSTTSYEVTPHIEVANINANHRFDVVNLHKWDIILGSVFCNKHKVHLDYDTHQIHFGGKHIGGTSIPTLAEKDGVRPRPSKARMAAMHD